MITMDDLERAALEPTFPYINDPEPYEQDVEAFETAMAEWAAELQTLAVQPQWIPNKEQLICQRRS